MCALLKPFQHIIVSIEKDDAPSLFLVPMCCATLKQVLQCFETVKKFNKENVDEKKENQLLDDSFGDDLEDELPVTDV